MIGYKNVISFLFASNKNINAIYTISPFHDNYYILYSVRDRRVFPYILFLKKNPIVHLQNSDIRK